MNNFNHICETLFGFGWQSALSRELNVNDRTVRRWKAESAPRWVYEYLEVVRIRKIKELHDLKAKMLDE